MRIAGRKCGLTAILACGAVLMCLCAMSCNKETYEWTEFEGIPLELHGDVTIVSKWPSDKKVPMNIYCHIASDGGEFTLEEYGDMAKYGMFTSGCLESEGGMTDVFMDNLQGSLKLSFDSPSWSFEYIEAEPPYKLKFKINKNDTQKERTFRFNVGYGYCITYIAITQPAAQ